MNMRSAHDSDAPRWFDNWTNGSLQPHLTWIGTLVARLEAWLGGKFERQQESQDLLGAKLDKLLERMESLETKVDKLQGTTHELAKEKSAMSPPKTFNEIFAEASAKSRLEDEEQAKRKAQMYKKIDETKPASVFVRSQLVTNEEIHKLALKLPGFCSTHYDGTKATITVEGTRWVTNAQEVMPKYMDGTPIEVIDHAEVRGRIHEFARGLPGYRGVEFTDRAAHITIAVSQWTEANKKTLHMMYGYRIYLVHYS